ncbi:M14 family zinc carboxypeptidase [Modestobacter marinus]|uniref:M14 family zinc carboxypeptidase n=1 Tax=Modestobacter marinus TaxID=477641 RepID=UPI0034D69976
MWRKNRRFAEPGQPACPTGGGNGPGVDLNRNYDFLWDFPTAFRPQAPVATSTNPAKRSTADRAWSPNRRPPTSPGCSTRSRR